MLPKTHMATAAGLREISTTASIVYTTIFGCYSHLKQEETVNYPRFYAFVQYNSQQLIS